mmetsp:Transcript_8826/g.26059  ORF Transcript_8826/g.26059 Transcript_8826/m.26059 type:complete len:338 (+) Transcript_8826:2641-3654(+)
MPTAGTRMLGRSCGSLTLRRLLLLQCHGLHLDLLMHHHLPLGVVDQVIEVDLFDRVPRARRNLQDRALPEVVGKRGHVERGTHQDDPHVSPADKQLLQQNEQEVGHEVTLMHLVHEHVRVALKIGVAGVHEAPEQDAHRAELDAAVPRLGWLRVAAHAVADRLAQLLAALPGHALRHGDRRDAPRLGHDDPRAPRARAGLGLAVLGGLAEPKPVVQDVLRQLRALAAPRAAAHHHDALVRQQLRERAPQAAHGQQGHAPLALRVLLGVVASARVGPVQLWAHEAGTRAEIGHRHLAPPAGGAVLPPGVQKLRHVLVTGPGVASQAPQVCCHVAGQVV